MDNTTLTRLDSTRLDLGVTRTWTRLGPSEEKLDSTWDLHTFDLGLDLDLMIV